jgi:tetratricopeptide (TPR) repeat protein
MWRIVLIGLAVSALGVASWFLASSHFRVGVLSSVGVQTNAPSESDIAPARFVGRQACTACHPQEDQLWQGSHHDLAMQEANEQTVLGDFNQAELTHFGVTSSFYQQDGRYMVRTDGPDGALHDYAITFAFGVTPLQQYLIELPGGRLQAFSIAWDSRSAREGGQRWFHLYADEPIRHDDILHWTSLNQNWNFMCAECHSTDLNKNYDLAANGYRTTWSEIDVSCEACHGPGSRHVEWAKRRAERKGSEPYSDSGLLVSLKDRHHVQWGMDATTGNARRSTPRTTDHEIQVCGRCHSRRGVIAAEYVHGKNLLDTHLPALLDAGLYHVDGQIQGEVYEYGSFLQSKMYQQGVTCSDCHDPHSLRLRAPGEAVCTQCHLAEKYAARSHHFHPPGSVGASCVACHMPPTTYMVIDPRHDHSLRIPRPDLSVAAGTPNACNRCHADHTAEWAEAQVKRWYGRAVIGYQRYAEALQAGRTGQPGAEARLAKLAGEDTQPAIARATALSLLRAYLSPASIDAVRNGLRDPEPIVRRAALQALEGLSPQDRWSLAGPALTDPIRGVRIEAARLLAPLPANATTAEQRRLLDVAVQEYIEAQQANADRAEPHLNLGWLYTQRGQFADAEAAYRTALRLQPTFVQAYVNLADLYRVQGKDGDGERMLREGLAVAPDHADLQHALGLVLVRQQRTREAIAALEEAARLAPENPRYSYVYAVALHSTGSPRRAIGALKQALTRSPYDRDILLALATFHRDLGDVDAAMSYAERLLAVVPHDPGVQQLLQQLRSRR